eukprot:m.338279 g.338279  ORF g.338279 m.338279 type:complete len:129 (+) comp18368_c0_seq1:49-435(+)
MAKEPAKEPAEEKQKSARPLRGKPVSGRPWKEAVKRPHSSGIVKPKNKKKSSWAVRKEREMQLKDIKSTEAEMKVESSGRKQAAREKREERKKRKEENELKSEIVQAITNTAKLKKLNRKQLRNFAKR